MILKTPYNAPTLAPQADNTDQLLENYKNFLNNQTAQINDLRKFLATPTPQRTAFYNYCHKKVQMQSGRIITLQLIKK